MRFGLKREYLSILLLALVVRIIAAVFSQGYGMHDDHFLVIEASASWTEGYDYNHWLPWSQNTQGHPEGHSFTYVGLNYCYFAVMKGIGVSDPEILMLVNRLIHALLSMLVVIYGIKITEKLAGISSTKKGGVVACVAVDSSFSISSKSRRSSAYSRADGWCVVVHP